MKKPKWILLADDDEAMAELTTLALGLKELACDVIVARDGLEALDCLHRRGKFLARTDGDPLFVMLDVKMPRVDGLDVLRQMKSDARLKCIPVVMFSSSRESADVRRSYQLGANAFVVKPVEFRDFNEALARVGRFWALTNESAPVDVPAEEEVPDSQPLAATV